MADLYAPIIHPITDRRGIVTHPWALFFQQFVTPTTTPGPGPSPGPSPAPTNPGGPEGAVQFNQMGAFGGESAFRYDAGTRRVIMAGQYYSEAEYVPTASGPTYIDWDLGNEFILTLTGPTTIVMSNPVDGGRYAVLLRQDATGGRTVTWPATVAWPRGIAPTLSTTPGYLDLTTFMYVAAINRYIGSFNLGYQVP